MKPHRLRGALVIGLSGLALGLLMFLPRLFMGGIAVGFGLLLAMVAGVLDFFGAIEISRDPPPPPAAGEKSSLKGAPWWLRWLAGFNLRLLYLGLALMAAGACRVSVLDTMGASAPWTGPLFFGLGILAAVAARFYRRPFDGDLHEEFLVVSLATATLMATLGSQGLWDCWETHYGEIARRQLEQDDWISLFWEAEWFYSKPILIFWLMNLGMALFGVSVGPDSIPDHAEWGMRFFVAVISIAVIWALYRLVAARVSKRAGLFVSLVIGTMPLYNFMARQAITDMPFVGFMTIAVVLFLFGATAGPDEQAGVRKLPIGRGRYLSLSPFHAVVAGYVILAAPQFLYLATRSARFNFGTLGRDDIHIESSQHSYFDRSLSDYYETLFGYPVKGTFDISLDWFLLGLIFALVFGLVLFTLRRERRVSRLCYHGMYQALALSVLAKGAAGVAMPLLGLIGFWLVVAPWKELRFGLRAIGRFLLWHFRKIREIDLLRGIPMFLVIGAPWYVAMIVRHGDAFINRFFIHDHLKRLAEGVHGDTGTSQYFVKQFAYAAFPWVALLPFALLAWAGLDKAGEPGDGRAPKDGAKRLILIFTTCWTLSSFALLAMMKTKFHHYSFPLIPPAALLIGLFVDDVWQGRVRHLRPIALVAAAVIGAVVWDLTREPNKAEGVFDGYAQLVGLFIYKYVRPYPEGADWDFSKPILVFGILLGALFAAWAIRRTRRLALVATACAALAFSHWISEHYMVQLAPHWTQKHLIQEYYAERGSSAERLVAFQMNWKGENFYTGNRVVVKVSTTNNEFEQWVDQHRGERHFFITEQLRFNAMSRRARAASGPIRLLSDTCNKYRIGVADRL